MKGHSASCQLLSIPTSLMALLALMFRYIHILARAHSFPIGTKCPVGT